MFISVKQSQMSEAAPAKQKKPRSEAQIKAFERARAAREANMRKKFEAEQELKRKAAEPEPEEEHEVELSEYEEDEEEHEQIQEEPAVRPAKKAKKVRSESAQPKAEQDEYIEIQEDSALADVYSRLDEMNSRFQQLQEQHGVFQKNLQDYSVPVTTLNFV